jgi:threonine dehydrogenase-like Zn-dependent dehydrogenase
MCGGMKMEKMYGFTSVNVAPGLWGGYSEFVYLDPHALIHRLADSVPTETAPFYVPLANGIRWTQLEGGIGVGDTVVILGPGGQGLACVIAAKEAGAANIIVTGRARDANRLALAREFGAHHTIDVDAGGDVVAQVAEVTDGHMADAVINVTARAPGATQQAVELATLGGTIVVVGEAHGPAADFEPDLLFLKELTIKGVRGRTAREMKKAIKLLESNRYPLHKLATHHFTLDQVDRAIRTVGGEGEPGSIHVSVLPRVG